ERRFGEQRDEPRHEMVQPIEVRRQLGGEGSKLIFENLSGGSHRSLLVASERATVVPDGEARRGAEKVPGPARRCPLLSTACSLQFTQRPRRSRVRTRPSMKPPAGMDRGRSEGGPSRARAA